MLYPQSTSLPTLNSKVSEVAHVLSAECFADRYALTLRLMLSNFRRKTGALSTVPGTPRGGQSSSGTLPPHPATGPEAVGAFTGGLQSLLSLPGLDQEVNSETWPMFTDTSENIAWPNDLSPSNMPSWLQDNVRKIVDESSQLRAWRISASLWMALTLCSSLWSKWRFRTKLTCRLANMFLPSGTTSSAYQFGLSDSADVGAEAW
jgi:hypothetical protein